MNNILKVALTVVVTLILAGILFFAGSMFGSFAFQRNNMPMMQNGARSQGSPNNDQSQGSSPNGQTDRDGQRNWQGNHDGRMGQGQGDGPSMRMPDGGMGRGPDMGMPGDNMGRGPGMGMRGPGNMPDNLTPVTTDEAQKAAEAYITSIKVSGLEVDEVLIINTHAYVTVKETATGNGAFELMVDPLNKVAHPAMGLASAWNLKYGGVLQANNVFGRGPKGPQNLAATATPAANATAAPLATPADVSAEMTLTEAEAIKAAQTYLDTYYTGATAATTALKFYGYYSISFSKDGNVIGKLSVNGYNGQVDGRSMNGRP